MSKEGTFHNGPRSERPYLNIQAEVATALHKEGIKAPPLVFDVALITHESASDMHPLLGRIDACDVFIPEVNGMTSEQRSLWQQLCDGKITPLQCLKRSILVDPAMQNSKIERALVRLGLYTFIGAASDFFLPAFNRLHGSKKAIAHIDTLKVDALKDLPEVLEQRNFFFSKDYSYSEALRAMAKTWQRTSILMRKRDDEMLSNLVPALIAIIKARPDLRAADRKKPIKVFMFLGSYHLPIVEALENSDVACTHTYSTKLSEYRYATQYVRSAAAGVPVSEDLLSRTLLASTFDMLVANTTSAELRSFLKLDTKAGAVRSIIALTDTYADKAGEVYEYVKKIYRQRDGKFQLREINRALTAFAAERRDEIIRRMNSGQ